MESIDLLESQIPALAAAAINLAYRQALALGGSVLEAHGGVIYEIFPNGERRFVKNIEPPVPVKLGQKILLQ